MTLPLLIGGATTSRQHTAVKIAPAYAESTVPRARRLARGRRGRRPARPGAEARARRRRTATSRRGCASCTQASGRKLLPLADRAATNRPPIEWRAEDLPCPRSLGRRVLEDVPLARDRPVHRLDVLLHGLGAARASSRRSSSTRSTARPRASCYANGQQAARPDHARASSLTARGVYGFWPANSRGRRHRALRRRRARDGARALPHAAPAAGEDRTDKPYLALADFVAPRETGLVDHVGAFAVTAGHRRRRARRDASRRSSTTTARSWSRRSPTAWPRPSPSCSTRARARDWGYGASEKLTTDDLIAERYRGIRPAFGYPACPDHTEKRKLFALLDAADGRHPAHRALRDDAGRERQRHLLRASRGALLRRRQDRSRPGRGLRRAARG